MLIAKNGNDLLEQLQPLINLPDIILMDYKMPGMNGIQTTRIISKTYPSIKIIALSVFHHNDVISGMIEAGAKGFLSKSLELDILEKAINTVLDNQYFIETDNGIFEVLNVTEGNKKSLLLSETFELTDRQIEFLKWSVEDLAYKEIATKMNISCKTVENYRDLLFKKFNVHSRIGLVMYAIKIGLTDIID